MAQCHDMRSSNDSYRVLQVDDEGGQGKICAKRKYSFTQIIGVYVSIVDSSGKRISDLSGPLAQGKFSIFYMSTYQTDFVLVNLYKLHKSVILIHFI